MPSCRVAAETPRLSVIVPVYNDAEALVQCLKALAASVYTNFEVLVIDDGSTDPVAPLAQRHGFRSLRIDGPSGPARARNCGVADTDADIVVFIDADVCVSSDTLARFAEHFTADPTLAAVIGAYDDAPTASNFLSQYKNLFHHFVHHRHAGEASTFWSGCGAMRRDVFLAFNGFDEQRYRRPAIEDIELGTWVSAAGHRIVLDPRITATHLKRWTLWSLLKTDIVDRGVPWVRLMLRARTVTGTLNVAPAERLSVVLVYLACLGAIAALRWPALWMVVVGLVLFVTVLNRAFYRYFATQRGVWFALRAAPLHWLYFGYCGLCAVWGALLHVMSISQK